MTNQQLFEAIEGDIMADLLYASSSITLQGRMEKNETLQVALERFIEDQSFQREALERAKAVSRYPEQAAYPNPYRTVLAAYMYLFFNGDNSEGLRFILDQESENRGDLAEVGGLIRLYASHRPALEIQEPVSSVNQYVEIGRFIGPEADVNGVISNTKFSTCSYEVTESESSTFAPRKGYAVAA